MNTLVLSTEQVSFEMLAITVIWINSCNYTGDLGFPCVSDGKDSACNARNLSSIPGLGRSLGEEKSYPLQYSGLENSMGCIVHRVAKSWTQLSYFHFTHSADWDSGESRSISLKQTYLLGLCALKHHSHHLPAKLWPVFQSLPRLHSPLRGAGKTLPVIELAQCFKKSLQYSLENRKTAFGAGWGQRITNGYRQHQLASLISSNSLMACSYSGGSAFSSDSKTSQKAWWTMCLTRPAKLWEWNESLFFT